MRKIICFFSPNPFRKILKRAKKYHAKNFLFAWNRGLGDIATGLYGLIYQVKEKIADANITFLIREELKEGFALLPKVNIITAPDWKREKDYDVKKTLESLHISPSSFDVIITWPDPTYWNRSLRGKIIPRLKWQDQWDSLYKKFSFPEKKIYIGVQPHAETHYGLWRNWPQKYWEKLFSYMDKKCDVKFILFGFNKKVIFPHANVIDLRGETSLFDVLSIIKNCCSFLILPDSGILTISYYLDVNFPIEVISLWADYNHGILKQNVFSCNRDLVHNPFIAEKKDLKNLCPIKIANFICEKINEKEKSLCKIF